jgi:hypothetical protein
LVRIWLLALLLFFKRVRSVSGELIKCFCAV